jgi:hypothetical protein
MEKVVVNSEKSGGHQRYYLGGQETMPKYEIKNDLNFKY